MTLTALYKPVCHNKSSNYARVKFTILDHHYFFVEWIHLITQNSPGEITLHNYKLIDEGIYSLRNLSCQILALTSPGCNPITSLLWPAGKAALAPIFPREMPDKDLVNSRSIIQRTDMCCKYDKGNIRSILGEKESLVLNLTKPFVVAVIHNFLVFIDRITKEEVRLS